MSGSKDEIIRLIRTCHLLYKRGFVRGSQGNASIRLDHDRILIKPSGKSFRDLKGADLISVGMTGKIVQAWGKPSIETPVHLAIYKTRRDVNVVLHTHPLNVIKFSLLNSPLELLEVGKNTAIVPYVKYMKPGSKELASAVSKEIKHHDAVILGKHGLIAVGRNVVEAYDLIEVVEKNAEIQNGVRAREF